MTRSRPKAEVRLAEQLVGSIAVAFVLGVVCFGGHWPGAGSFRPPLDKLAHFALYFSLGCGAWLATRGRYPFPVIVAGGALGALDEWRQFYLPGRHPDGGDWVVDVVALAAAVIGFALLWHRWSPPRFGKE